MSFTNIGMGLGFLRVGFRFFVEGIFICFLLNTNVNHLNISKNFISPNKKKTFLFSFVYAFVSLFGSFYFIGIFRLFSIALVFLYSWYKQREMHKKLIINYNVTQDTWFALTSAIILVLAVHSFNAISHMLLHTCLVSMGFYSTIRSFDIYYEIYKFAIMLLDVFFIFLAYKLQFIKIKDIKAMSAYKRIPILFGFCLLSIVYIDVAYDKIPLSIAPYREGLLWIMALTLPTYIGFYATTTYLTRLLSLRSNANADTNIHMWLFNPSIFNTTSLSVYDSDVFTANFESKKLAIKKRLDKLEINDECKGYSGLIFCLFLTRLFMGLKGWSFKTDIFLQASLVIDVPTPKLRKDIENIIEQVWTTSEAETLIDGYYFPYHNSKIYDQMERPTVEEFLTDMAKSI